MRQPRPQMIASAVQENLRLVFESAKCARMNNARAVALKFRPVCMTRLGIFSSARIAGFLREWREHATFVRFHLLAPLPTIRTIGATGRDFFCHDSIIRHLSILASPDFMPLAFYCIIAARQIE